MTEENLFLETYRPLGRPPEPRTLFYILSFFLPAGGLALAAIFMGRAEEDHTRFGRRCLIAVVISIGAAVIFWTSYTIFIIALMVGEPPSF